MVRNLASMLRPGTDGSLSRSSALLRAAKLTSSVIFALSVLLCAAAAYAASGRRPRLPTQQEVIGQQLQSARRERQQGAVPTLLQAHVLTYDVKTHTYTLSGAARVVQGSTSIKADKISIQDGYLGRAVGHVRLTDPTGDVQGKAARFNLHKETATLDNGSVYALSHYRLSGKKLQKLPGQRYVATDASLTTCSCGSSTPDWGISAKHLDVQLEGMAKAQGAAFDILGYPVVPIPFAEFDTNSERHSGFLTPQVGESTLNGFEFRQPYFLDISKSQDVTGQFDFESATRIGGQLEYRLTNGPADYIAVTGNYFNESIRSEQNRLSDLIDPQIADPTIPIERWGLVGVMQEHLTPNLFAYGNLASSSDSLFFREIPQVALSPGYGWNSGLWQTTRDAVSNFGLIDELPSSYVQLQGIWNQDLIQRQAFALQTLPSIAWTGYQSLLGGKAYLDYNTSAIDYYRQLGVDGLRFDVNPNVTVPWAWSRYLDGWATVGVNAATYDVSGHQITVIPVGTQGLTYNNGLKLGRLAPGGLMGRVIPDANFGIRSALVGKTPFDHLGIGEVETLVQPFAQYSYVPTINQSQFPLFDSIDRIEPRSLLYYGTSVRIFGSTSGPLENNAIGRTAQAMMGPSFTDASGNSTVELVRFTLEQAYDTTYAVAPDGSHLSDAALQAWLFPTKLASGGATVDWSPRTGQGLDAATFSLLFQPPGQFAPSIYTGRALEGSFFQFSYTYTAPNATLIPVSANNAISAVSMEAYVGLLKRLGVYFAPMYDISTSRLIADVLGVRIKSPCNCWLFDFAMNQSYYPRDTSFTFQITLGGLGSIGGSPFGSNPFQIMGLLPTRAPVPAQ